MKNRISVLLATMPFLAFAQEGSFTLVSKVGTYNKPAKAYLMYRNGVKTITDSTNVKAGSFQFTGKLAAPGKATLVLDTKGIGWTQLRKQRNVDALNLYLEAGTITLASSDSVSKAKITGSTLNDDNIKFQEALMPVSLKFAALNSEFAAATPEQQKDAAFRAGFQKRAEVIEGEQKEITKRFILENPKSFISLDALKTYGGYFPEASEVEPLFTSLDSTIRATPSGQEYAQVIEKAKVTAVGAMAPDFTQNDPKGKPVKLSDFRGKYVLLDFWASWCGPCRRENPNVVANFNKYKDRNFTVLGVSLDREGDKAKWLKAIEDDKLTWTHVSDLKYFNNAAAVQYGIEAIPQNYLIGPDGKILAKNLREEELGQKLEEVLAGK